MAKHVAGGGRRVASARSVNRGEDAVGLVNVNGRVNNALRENGMSSETLRETYNTSFRVGDNGVITVTGTENGLYFMARVLGQRGGRRLGNIKLVDPTGNLPLWQTRWRLGAG